MNSLDWPAARDEMSEAVKYLSGNGKKVGVTGFCMGGALALIAAQHSGVAAAAPFYGVPEEGICQVTRFFGSGVIYIAVAFQCPLSLSIRFGVRRVAHSYCFVNSTNLSTTLLCLAMLLGLHCSCSQSSDQTACYWVYTALAASPPIIPHVIGFTLLLQPVL
jgi:hypothetical protein